MHILVVDDHPLFLDALRHTLIRLAPNTTIDQARSAEEALGMIDPHKGYDLLLVDLGLPELDGTGFLRSMLARGLWIPCAVISATEIPSAIYDALESGALGFIPKTYDGAQILRALEQILAGEHYLPDYLQTPIARLRHRRAGNVAQGISIATEHGITRRQLNVLELMARGYSNKQIAMTLNVTEHTVKSHVKALLALLHTDNRTACVQRASQLRIIGARSATPD